MVLAVEGGHTEVVQVLIKAGADINHVVAEEDTPLHLAIRYNHYEAAILLAQQPDIAMNAKVSDPWYPLLVHSRQLAHRQYFSCLPPA